MVPEQDKEHILALVLKLVEVLHMVVELVHKLEQVQHMDDQLEKALAVEQAQHMVDLLVPVLVEEQAHHMVSGRLQVELYFEWVHQQVGKNFGDKVVVQEQGKDKAVEQGHHMGTSLAVNIMATNMENRHRTYSLFFK